MTNSKVCQGSCIFPEKDDKTRGQEWEEIMK